MVVNWQVDEPLVKPEYVEWMINRVWCGDIWTLMSPMIDGDAERSDVVKVVCNEYHKTCYWFSRAPMAGAYNHVGVYAFDLSKLKMLDTLKTFPYAGTENLEQLNWIEADHKIFGYLMDHECFGINTNKDLNDFRRIKGRIIRIEG